MSDECAQISRIRDVAKRAGVKVTDARRVIRAVIDLLNEGQEVHLVRLGRFYVSEMTERRIETGKIMDDDGAWGVIPDGRRVVRFRQAPTLKKIINGEMG